MGGEGLIQFFYVKDNQVFLKEKFRVIPEIIAIEKECGDNEERRKKIFEYLHFVYSKKSPYFYIELSERKKIVCFDRFEDATIAEKLDNVKVIKPFIEKYNQMQFTENETFLNGVRQKISEYLRHWQSNPITKNNSAEIQEQLKGAKELLKVKKELEEIVYEEVRNRNIADESGEKMFERDA